MMRLTLSFAAFRIKTLIALIWLVGWLAGFTPVLSRQDTQTRPIHVQKKRGSGIVVGSSSRSSSSSSSSSSASTTANTSSSSRSRSRSRSSGSNQTWSKSSTEYCESQEPIMST